MTARRLAVDPIRAGQPPDLHFARVLVVGPTLRREVDEGGVELEGGALRFDEDSADRASWVSAFTRGYVLDPAG